jgi:hypothetical protein
MTKLELLQLRDHESVLTAMRGPDVSYQDVIGIKMRTTAVIRACISDWWYGDIAPDNIKFEIGPGDCAIVGEHFLTHALRAAKVLGLVPHYHPTYVLHYGIIGRSAGEVKENKTCSDAPIAR